MNLIHWIGSFSTVGLETHLGLNKKAEGGKKTFTFSFFHEKEERAKEKEVELGHWHNFLEEILHRNRGVWTAFNALYR